MMRFAWHRGAAVQPFSLEQEVRAAAGDPEAVLRLAPQLTRELGLLGDSHVREHWEGLATLAALDLTAARTLEPHLDALSILGQARRAGHIHDVPAGATWGVYAAEGPGPRLRATRAPAGPSEPGGLSETGGLSAPGAPSETGALREPGAEPNSGDTWVLDGGKQWCSLADTVSHALVTAWTSEHGRTLFAVDLRHPGVSAGEDRWVSRGLSAVRTLPLSFDGVPAQPVGPEEWYLSRPGFALGSVGVAAIWWGAACALAAQLQRTLSEREPDQIALMHLGACDAALHAAGAALDLAAHEADSTAHAWPQALRVRGIVHDACERTLTAVGHALGPGPLTQDEEYARRVADLQVYLRQHKPERDLAGVGAGLLDGMRAPWSTQ